MWCCWVLPHWHGAGVLQLKKLVRGGGRCRKGARLCAWFCFVRFSFPRLCVADWPISCAGDDLDGVASRRPVLLFSSAHECTDAKRKPAVPEAVLAPPHFDCSSFLPTPPSSLFSSPLPPSFSSPLPSPPLSSPLLYLSLLSFPHCLCFSPFHLFILCWCVRWLRCCAVLYSPVSCLASVCVCPSQRNGCLAAQSALSPLNQLLFVLLSLARPKAELMRVGTSPFCVCVCVERAGYDTHPLL